MMTIGSTGADAAKYLCQYLEEGGDGRGVWLGTAAEQFGLDGPVGREDLDELLTGHLHAERLTRNAGPEHFSGHEITLSAPKSFSVLCALSDDARRAELRAVFHDAVEETVAKLEAISYTRRGAGGHIVEPVRGLFVAAFEHEVSRPTKGHAPDPQHHVHLIIPNVGLSADGKTRALLGISRPGGGSRSATVSPFYERKMELGAFFRERLAQNLERRGYRVQRNEQGFAIEGVPPELCRHFSKRRAAIEAELTRVGETGAKAAERATLVTRERKRAIDLPALRQHWRAEAKRLGLELAPTLPGRERERARPETDRGARRDHEPTKVESKARVVQADAAQPHPVEYVRNEREAKRPLEPRSATRTKRSGAPREAAKDRNADPSKTSPTTPREDGGARTTGGHSASRVVEPSARRRRETTRESEAQRNEETRRAVRGSLLTPVTGLAPVSLWTQWRAKRELQRDGVLLSPEERAKTRGLTFNLWRRRELRAATQAEKENTLHAAVTAWRRDGARIYVVSPLPATVSALRRRGLRAFGPTAFTRGLSTKRTWRDTFHILRGDEMSQDGSRLAGQTRTNREGGRMQFRSLSAFLQYAQTTKNRTWFHFDRRTVLILDEPERMRPADLAATTRRAHRGGATIVTARTQQPTRDAPQQSRGGEGGGRCRS